MTRRMRASTQAGHSLETLLYHNLAARFASDRVTFDIAEGYLLYSEILGYTVRWHHGDAVRYYGGVGGVTIPMNKAIAQWDKTQHADISVNGHFHTYMSLNHCVINGSLVGFSPYALRVKAAYEAPTQAFFVISQKYGKTTSNPIICL